MIDKNMVKLQIEIILNKNADMVSKASMIREYVYAKILNPMESKKMERHIIRKMRDGGSSQTQSQMITDYIMNEYVHVKGCEEEDPIKEEEYKTLLIFDFQSFPRMFMDSEEDFKITSAKYTDAKYFVFDIQKLPDSLKNIWKNNLDYPVIFMYNVAQNYLEVYKKE